jgi:hypothetical protein
MTRPAGNPAGNYIGQPTLGLAALRRAGQMRCCQGNLPLHEQVPQDDSDVGSARALLEGAQALAVQAQRRFARVMEALGAKS